MSAVGGSESAIEERPGRSVAKLGPRIRARLRILEATRAPLILIIAVGALLRFVPTAFGSFPLGDGGLYLVMVKAFEAGGLAIPSSVTYGAQALPYAYPPAAFWLTAVAHNLTGLDELRLMMLLPPAFATAAIGAAYLAARAFFESEPVFTRAHSPRRLALVAATIFALAPGAYQVVILGGGLTKAPGLFFVLLALWRLLVLLTRQRPSDVLALALFGGVAALFHPDGALFLALSAVVLLVWHASWRVAGLLIAAAAGSALVCAPWWLSVLANHGSAPLFSASGLGLNPTLASLSFLVIPLIGMTVFLPVLVALGLVVSARRRSAVLAIWLFAVCLADARNSSHDGTFIVALLGAVGALYGGLPLARAVLRLFGAAGLLRGVKPASLAVVLALAALILVPAQALLVPLSAVGLRIPLGPGDLAAFSAVQERTSPETSAAVITGVGWGYDDLSEWFPALTGRTSVNTVQGYEWAGSNVWAAKNLLSGNLQNCVNAAAPLSCVESTLARYHAPVGLLYVAGPQSETAQAAGEDLTAALRTQLDADGAHWRLLFRSSAASVYVTVSS